MNEKVKTIAFDLGGVLAYQDLSVLTEEEKLLFQTYMNRNKGANRELLEYAKSKIAEIYLKIHRLNIGTISTLEMLQEKEIRSSIWTNNIKEIDAWLEEAGLYRYIRREDIVNSIYLGVDKPDLEFYHKALYLLKNSPSDVLFLDDNYDNVLGAQICGVKAKVYNMSESLEETVETAIGERKL